MGLMFLIGSCSSAFDFLFSVHLNVAHVFDALESAVVLVLDNALALPICSDDLVLTSGLVEYGRHLESK